MPSKQKTKTYPSDALVVAARAAGAHVRLLWEVPGPKDTAIAWMSCYQIGSSACIVQTYADDNGWEAFTPHPSRDVAETIADVLNRCGVPTTSFRRLAVSVPS